MRSCSECGKDFEQSPGKGRRRKKCYDCSPARTQQRQQAKQEPPAAAEARRGNKCPWCGAYCIEAFCNSQHRALFAEKVADAKRGHPRSAATPRKGRPAGHGVYGTGRRPLARLRKREQERIEHQKAEARKRKEAA